ncbi:MAG TPA: DUF3093 domain-containing protein [Actinospica sp.]|nr:DUF3093 domain-containing protein [Actinospica sp.]
MTSAESPAYREQLRAPASWYFIGFLFGLALACIFLWFGPWQALAGLVGGTLVSAWVVASYGRVGIELDAEKLKAGPATLPLTALGTASALSAEQARALQTHEADPRAFMLLRSYVKTAVRVEVVDPQDPHPYLYLSSRRPEKLAAAFARANAVAGS